MAAKTRIQRRLRREVDEIWQYHTGGNLTIFNKDHGTVGSRRFLQPSIRLRYNYYVQLVATKRDWIRVANLKILERSPKGGVYLVPRSSCQGLPCQDANRFWQDLR